ncbi:MAG TPA: hypothetical protein VGQ83_26905 [Polyangia bacterium]
MRYLSLVVLVVALGPACGGRAGPVWAGDDGGAAPPDGGSLRHDGGPPGPDGGAADGAVTTACGSAPQLVVNGTTYQPAVGGNVQFTDCGAGVAQLVFTPVTSAGYDLAHRVVFTWQAPPAATYPLHVDLANPPPDFQAKVDTGCGDPIACCASPTDTITRSLQGTLDVGSQGPLGSFFGVSLCLDFAESAQEPHPVIHSLSLGASDLVHTP